MEKSRTLKSLPIPSYIRGNEIFQRLFLTAVQGLAFENIIESAENIIQVNGAVAVVVGYGHGERPRAGAKEETRFYHCVG